LFVHQQYELDHYLEGMVIVIEIMLMRRAFAHKCRSLIKHPLYAKFFCPDCYEATIEEFQRTVNYFSLYLMYEPHSPQKYEINKLLLTKKYKDYQMLLHPDILQARGIQNQEYSKLISLGYQTLFQDASRAMYMVASKQLKILGKELDFNQRIDDASFMERMFDLRCELHSDICSQATVAEILLKSQEEKANLAKEINDAFAINDTDAVNAGTLRLQFYDRLESDAKGLLHLNESN
jgi:DnaJ-domain-containing protein 1